MSSKDPYVKGLVTSLWCCWEVVESLRGGAYQEEVIVFETESHISLAFLELSM